MAQSSSRSSTGSDQSAGADAEEAWLPFIDDYYPDLLNQTHVLPSAHFSRTPQTLESFAGQAILVNVNPSERPHQQMQSPPPPHPTKVVPPSGVVFSQDPSNMHSVQIRDSDCRGDAAHQRCLSALSGIDGQVMMIISSLHFRKYLSNFTNPLYAAAIALLPTIEHPSISQNLKDGECDLIIIHRQYGIIVGEVKSVGGSSYFGSQTVGRQNDLLRKQVKKAAEQLNSQATVLKHLLSDLPQPVTITKAVMLPNITGVQLRLALSSSIPLLQELCQAFGVPEDISQALRHCLCKDDLERVGDWWRQLNTDGPDSCMTDDVFKRLVARFCGPATTIDVPTAGPPRKAVRSQGQAVAETGLRFSALVLTPEQVSLLNLVQEPQYLYLEGPPGTGKTVCLLLKALQWVWQGKRVVVVSGLIDSRAVCLLLREQLCKMVEPAAAARIHQHSFDITEGSFDAGVAVLRLRQRFGRGPFLLIFDEAFNFSDSDRYSYVEWMTEVRAQLPDVTVWTAGVRRLDRILTHQQQLPPWLEVQTLQESLRCPPTVTTVLQQSWDIQDNYTLPYTAPQHPVATQGPPVKEMRHRHQPGHSGHFPWRCIRCTDDVYDILTNQLRVGQPDHSLQCKDVFVLYGGDDPRADDLMILVLQQRGLPVRAVTSHPPSPDDVEELALAVNDAITVAHSDVVQGLERRVVIALNIRRYVGSSFPASSRCSSGLYCID